MPAYSGILIFPERSLLMLNVFKYYFLLVVVILFQVKASGAEKMDGESDCETFISIDGSSNINQFRLVNFNPKINKGPDGEGMNYQFKIPVDDFSGPNNRILNDFHQMLNASKYPYIQIGMESKELADFDEGSGKTNFRAMVTIAGESQKYIIPCEILFCEKSGVIISGDLKVKLTDFNIDPPQKVFGAIKVNNEVFVNFAFSIKPEEVLSEKIP